MLFGLLFCNLQILLKGILRESFLHRIFSMSEDVLNFILEFVNWSRLPPIVEQHFSQYKEKFTWNSKSRFGKEYRQENNVSAYPASRLQRRFRRRWQYDLVMFYFLI